MAQVPDLPGGALKRGGGFGGECVGPSQLAGPQHVVLALTRSSALKGKLLAQQEVS